MTEKKKRKEEKTAKLHLYRSQGNGSRRMQLTLASAWPPDLRMRRAGWVQTIWRHGASGTGSRVCSSICLFSCMFRRGRGPQSLL